ncbi:hypothetical protein FJZ40_02180 [Candidatus Shapirobacteria bacterium]|nr:hypothetical protein [Candidatus Shapirobacteria bacterium]
MALDKNSLKSDAVVNLYRAALYLARGSKEVGLEFLQKARRYLPGEISPEIKGLLSSGDQYLKTQKDCLFWAEKILDQYHLLK